VYIYIRRIVYGNKETQGSLVPQKQKNLCFFVLVCTSVLVMQHDF
jgi:hypothetical protein